MIPRARISFQTQTKAAPRFLYIAMDLRRRTAQSSANLISSPPRFHGIGRGRRGTSSSAASWPPRPDSRCLPSSFRRWRRPPSTRSCRSRTTAVVLHWDGCLYTDVQPQRRRETPRRSVAPTSTSFSKSGRLVELGHLAGRERQCKRRRKDVLLRRLEHHERLHLRRTKFVCILHERYVVLLA